MFHLKDIYRVKGRKMILLNGSYNLRTDQLDGHWEEVASPRIAIYVTSLEFEQTLGTPSDEQYYTVTGYNMEGDLVISAPENFEISLMESSADTWGDTITLSPDSDLGIPTTKIYVRLNASAEGTYTGQIITHASDNMEGQVVELSGEAVLPPYTEINYGLLYNWYAATGGTFIEGWRVPSQSDMTSIKNTIGTGRQAYLDMRETGTTHWSFDDGVNNSSGFNAKGSGGRSEGGGFFSLLDYWAIWCNNSLSSTYGGDAIMYRDEPGYDYYLSIYNASKKTGLSIRLIKDYTVGDTIPDSVTDYDGNVYKVVLVGGKLSIAQNLISTHYYDGTPIPEVTDSTAWAALTTGALCAYNNDWDNV